MSDSQRVVVSTIDELPPGSIARVESGGRAACVVNVDGTVYAVDDQCLHKQASLSGGRLEGNLISCPFHWWRYSVVNGQLVGSEAALATYPAEVIGDEGVVVLPPPVKPMSMREKLLAAARGEI
jgi:nitrite reductase/ring-hydroxylating ferredoxin subunit